MSVKSVKLKTTLRIEGSLLLVMAVSMLPPLLIALAEKEAASMRAFLVTRRPYNTAKRLSSSL